MNLILNGGCLILLTELLDVLIFLLFKIRYAAKCVVPLPAMVNCLQPLLLFDGILTFYSCALKLLLSKCACDIPLKPNAAGRFKTIGHVVLLKK